MASSGQARLSSSSKMPINYVRVENPSEQEEELSKMDTQGVHEALSEEIFTSYQALSLPKSFGAIKHPGDIVEAGSLAAQSLPLAEYDLLPAFKSEIIEEGKLSDLQLEGILFACQRHQHILPNGSRAGFFIGDGAGVGKGRQIAGIILDNFARGRCQNIWFSISSDLRVDAERDLRDLGCYLRVIDGCQQLDKETRVFGLPKDFTEGVVFSTYATLVSSVQKGISSSRQSRLQQLIDWCGGDNFEGCLIFDECHKAKHFLPGNEKSSTKVALAVTEIQRLLPKSRVVYCSATGVTDVKNMAFMERLGLWGTGTAFKDFTPFLESITKRGLGTLEMLAMEMKAAGMYVSRGLSYRQTEFMTVEANLTPAQVKCYDQAVHIWNELKRSIAIAVDRTSTSVPRLWTHFWACHQRFFKQLCMSMKVPRIVEEAKKELANGNCVVIGLQTTGEASLGHEVVRSGNDIRNFISLTREILRRFIIQNFPTEVTTPEEKKEDQWCMKAKTMLLEFLEKISLPDSPLDEIIDKLGGPSNVAEMTGRSGRIVRLTPNGEPRYESRAAASGLVESLNIQERNSFMSGKKFVAIISDAASTGISLHADQRAENQKRRIHITAELPWSADKAVQQLGRSHRSNQTSGPIYKLITTNLGGERRFAAAVAKRLQSLGAITKGDRRAATGADLTQFNFDTIYGRQALRTLYSCISKHTFFTGVMFSDVLEGAQTEAKYTLEEFQRILRECLLKMDVLEQNVIGATVKESEAGNVSKFLNRILGLAVDRQNLIFSYFYEGMKSLIKAAKRNGRYSEGVTDVKANSIQVKGEPVAVFTEARLSTSTTKHVTLLVDRGLSWEEATKRREQMTGKSDGFYSSKREHKGRKLYILAAQKEHAAHLFTISRPNTGLSPFEESKADLLLKYQPIEPESAEQGWKLQYQKTESDCIHGADCKSKTVCRVGCRITELHLLCGGIISLLGVLELIVSRFAEGLNLTRESRTLRVVRVELDNGERLIGLKYPEMLIPEVSRLLKEQSRNSTIDKDYSIVKEKESPVIISLKTKATTPPITLKKFFKVKQKETNNSVNGVTCSSGQVDGTEEDRTRKETKISDSEVDSNKKVAASGAESKYFKKVDMMTQEKRKNGIKRTGSDLSITNSSKRHKQANIMLSFKNKKEPKVPTCPVCQTVFPTSLSNTDINKHIDQCLIE